MINSDFKETLRRYARRQAAPEEREQVFDYFMSNPLELEILVEMLRAQSMDELGLSPDDDFLPAHLQQCSPSEFAMSAAFGEYRSRVSASADRIMYSPGKHDSFVMDDEDVCKVSAVAPAVRRTMFEVLRDNLLPDELL